MSDYLCFLIKPHDKALRDAHLAALAFLAALITSAAYRRTN